MFKQEAHYQVEKNVMLNMYFKILQIKVKFWKRKLQNHPSYVAKQCVVGLGEKSKIKIKTCALGLK